MAEESDDHIAASPFSIDDEDDEEGALLAAPAADDDELEGNYSDGDDDASDEEEYHASSVKLASRTNMLMKNFNEYLTDITGEGDANGSSKNAPPPTLYRDFIDVEENNNLDDDPPTYEDMERELKMQGRYPKRKYISFRNRSKRVKRGIGMIIIAAIIIGVSVGFSTSKKRQRLPDWNEELEEQIEKEGITGDGLPGAKPEFSGPMGYEDSYNTVSQTATSNPNTNTNTNTQPIAENHKESSSVNHHAAGSGPNNHNVEVLNQPHQDNAHQILDGVTHSSSGSSSLQQAYVDAQTKYNPVWFDRSTWAGTTYQEALEFCGDRSMDICPYEAICPLGPSGHPNEGKKHETFGSWAPVKNDFNTWVQVGSDDDQCLLYSYNAGHAPEWGLVKGGNEQQTRHIMCCQVDDIDAAKDSAVDRNPNVPNSKMPDQPQSQQQQQESAFYNTEQTNMKPDLVADEYMAAEEWDPVWYSRSDGWTGQTYEEASEFCKSQGDTSDLCYYSIICPTGPNHLPYGGEIVETGRSWAPIKDSENGWVQVGSKDMCVRYMTLYLGTPAWGVTGEGNEEITRHLPCCTSPFLPTYAPTKPDDDDVSPDVPTLSNTSPLENVDMNIYELAFREYKPMWFDRSSGWNGQTWIEAKTFCGAIETPSDERMALCPYDAICPMGSTGVPFQGAKEHLFHMWAPVLGFQENEWVQIGSDQDTVCMTHRQAVGQPPEWGLTGEGNEEITRNVMCCTIHGGFSQQDDAVQIGQPASVADGQMNIYELAFREYKPKWFDRSSGWNGQTWIEAKTFCGAIETPSDERMALCPYDAICPMGSTGVPSQGAKEHPFHMWAPVLGFQENEWVQIGSDQDTVCMTHRQAVGQPPEWGLTGEGNEEITRNVMCCTIHGGFSQQDDDVQIGQPASVADGQIGQATSVADVSGALAVVEANRNPVKYDRSSGWEGTKYASAIIFCASQQSRIPCFYESICPNGENADPFGGVDDNPNGAWAPMMDAPNSWVQIGKVGTCQKYNDMHSRPPPWGLELGEDSEKFTRSLLCCEDSNEPGPIVAKPYSALTDKEDAVMNNLRPLWFDSSHGYRGTTHEEADLFCKAVIGMHLCPIEAYCPNGPTSDNKPLFWQKEPFKGEQWAPFASLSGTQSDLGNQYVMIGTLDGNPSSTCMPYVSLHTNPLPPWSADGSMTEIKQHVLCCDKKETMQQHAVISQGVFPVWLDQKHGWSGGSYQDAEEFCHGVGGKKLCPFSIYCHDGFGTQPLGGHSADLNNEGIQYAPIFGAINEWVMIGQKDGNAATTCMLHSQLEGGEPDWGLTEERQDLKNHILCCTF